LGVGAAPAAVLELEVLGLEALELGAAWSCAAEEAGGSLSARAGRGRAMRPQARPTTNELIKFLRDIEMKIFSDPSTIATP
jgi:hypothetical protein